MQVARCTQQISARGSTQARALADSRSVQPHVHAVGAPGTRAASQAGGRAHSWLPLLPASVQQLRPPHARCSRDVRMAAAASAPAHGGDAAAGDDASEVGIYDVVELRGIRANLDSQEPVVEYRVHWKDGSPDTWCVFCVLVFFGGGGQRRGCVVCDSCVRACVPRLPMLHMPHTGTLVNVHILARLLLRRELATNVSPDLVRDFDERWWAAAKKVCVCVCVCVAAAAAGVCGGLQPARATNRASTAMRRTSRRARLRAGRRTSSTHSSTFRRHNHVSRMVMC
jgi:hypothetical protein